MARIPYALVIVSFTLIVAAKFDPAGGFTSLLRFGSDWTERRLPALAAISITETGPSGYDGQFYAQIAIDPTLREPALERALDAPTYRSRRILLPAVAYVLGVGAPPFILQVFALLNVAAWFAFAALIYREISPDLTHRFARWLGCVFAMGTLESVRQSLTDLPAMVLLLLALRRAGAAPAGHAAFWSALAHLTKESAIVGSLAIFNPRSLRRWLWFGLSLVPLALWSWYVSTRFTGPNDAAGLGNFTWPLLGAWEQAVLSVRAAQSGDYDGRHLFALVAITGFAVQATVLLKYRSAQDPWWRMGVAYAALLLFLGGWVWSGYWAVCRAVLPLTIAFNLLLPRTPWFWLLWGLGNATALHGVWRFL